jgi:hypothetical protein
LWQKKRFKTKKIIAGFSTAQNKLVFFRRKFSKPFLNDYYFGEKNIPVLETLLKNQLALNSNGNGKIWQ